MICHLSFTVRRILAGCVFCAVFTTNFSWGQADDEPRIPWDEAQQLFKAGAYEELLPKLRVQTGANPWNDTWWYLQGKTLMTLGRYEEAYETIQEGLTRRTYSISLRLLAIEASKFNNTPEEAREHINALGGYFSMWARRVRSPDALIELGQVALMLGVEPRIVLENFFKRAQEYEDTPTEAYLVSGKLALDKHDYRLASQIFQTGLKKFPEDPDMWYGLAASFMNGDRSQLIEYAEKTLSINENHVPSMLLMAEHLIDAEAYDDAIVVLDNALKVNPIHPDVLAFFAVIAYLQNEIAAADLYRKTALSSWKTNPNVDHQIGRKLSQKYWFREGAEAQRRALAMDPKFALAKLQLAQDLLRLGSTFEDEGWKLANEAHDKDPYNVEAYNLVTLSDKIDEFVVIESKNFFLKMGAQEAAVYGKRASELLERAYSHLTEKYGITMDEKTTVEVYPNPGDFGVRTFGMPGNPGYLGVCFGPVVTVNSPTTRQANWESVLWHEFCHTITLKMTRNRIPRWLSEGISVYEEIEENSSWGRRMSLDYRERILDRKMQKISEMSAAFIQAQTDEDVQFAYFQSYLVVKFIFDIYGAEAMQKVLQDLGKGINTDEALESHVAPLEYLNRSFAVWAKETAQQVGGDYQLSKPETLLEQALSAINPDDDYQKALEEAAKLIDEEDWEGAREALEIIVERAGYLPGEDNAHGMLAYVYQKLDESEKELETLMKIAAQDAHHLDAMKRLMALALDAEDWKSLKRWSNAWLAINPLAETPWRGLFEAEENLNDSVGAVAAGEALVHLEPHDIASIHYRIAKQLIKSNKKSAHRQVLMALEEAPRYRDAYILLKELNQSTTEDNIPF